MRLSSPTDKLPVVAFLVLAGAVTAWAQGGPAETVGPALGKPIPPASLPAAPLQPSTGGLRLLVVGRNSANLVRFDLGTGKATVVAKLANGSQPWSLAVNPAGEIFVGLRGGKKNVVRLAPGPTGDPNGPLVPVDLTGTMGRFGPGLMAFDQRGLLNVAADTNRAVHRYDTKTGELVESMRLRAANLVGLTLFEDHVYAAEYFQKTILRFDLSADPAEGAKFVYKSEHLDVPHGMTIGHNGNLFVSSLRNSRVQEFDGETGEFLRTFVDVRTLGAGKVKDLHFEPRLQHYFISADDAVYVLAQDGTLLAKYKSDALSDAVAIAIVPASPPFAAASAEVPSRDASKSATSGDELRLRVFMGDPAVTIVGGNKLVMERMITIGKPFDLHGEHAVVVSGLVSRGESGELHFKGSVRTNASLTVFDSAAELGEGIRSQGGGSSGGFVSYFAQLDRTSATASVTRE